MTFPCPACGADTEYQMMSGGREFYCPGCGNNGSYPDDAEGLPRATLLRTPEGVVALRAQMDQEIARRSDTTGEMSRDEIAKLVGTVRDGILVPPGTHIANGLAIARHDEAHDALSTLEAVLRERTKALAALTLLVPKDPGELEAILDAVLPDIQEEA